MDNGGSMLSLSTPHFLHSTTILRRHSPVTSVSYSLKPPQPPVPQPPSEPPESPDLRRPEKSSSSSAPSSSPSPSPKTPLKNPLKGLSNRSSVQPEVSSKVSSFSSSSLASKLRLSSKLSPPPPPPPPMEETQFRDDFKTPKKPPKEEMKKPEPEFRQQGKIFVGNLPTWIKKPDFSEFFRQFGPIENVILIKGHHEVEKNAGFGFVIYAEEKSAMKAVEFDGVEFHGRVLTVKLDDGKRLKTKAEQRVRWVEEGEDDVKMENKSKWHQEREGSRKSLQRILDSNGDNWQAVISAFEKINKPSRTEFGLMVKFYGRRGDMHRARETFERMRARGITPTSRIYTR